MCAPRVARRPRRSTATRAPPCTRNATASANDHRRGQPRVGGGGAGDDDRLAERDDDERLEALGEVAALDRVVVGVRTAEAGGPVADQRRGEVDGQRGDPEPEAAVAAQRARRRSRARRRPRSTPRCARTTARSGWSRGQQQRAPRRCGPPAARRRRRRTAGRGRRTRRASRRPSAGWPASRRSARGGPAVDSGSNQLTIQVV